MFYYIRLALRNVGRNRRRSLLAIISVLLSVTLILFLQGLSGGMLGSLVKNYTKNETGHIRISTKEFSAKYRFHPVSANVKNPQEIIQTLQKDPQISPYIATITERTNFGVLLTNNGKSKAAVALGGDVEKEKNLLMLQKSIVAGGRYLQNERETILGAGIAEALGYKVGDTIKVVAQGSDYALHMKKFIVTGLFKTGMKALDDAIFQISSKDAKGLLRMGESSQQIIIMLKDYHKADIVAKMIRDKFQNNNELEISPWTGIGDYGKFVQSTSKIYSFICFVVAVLGAFIIGNIMMMVVLERRKEIGILKSMGVPQREILGLFLTEGAILGLAGSFGGVILGGIIVTIFHYTGMDFTKMSGSFNLPLDNIIYFAIVPSRFIGALILATVISSVLSMGPAWRASKMNVVESIKSI